MSATMRMLPVVWRELGAIARRRSVYWVRSGVGLAAFLAMGWVALVSLRMPLLDQGRSLFSVLGTGGFVFALVAGIRGTSDALSEEKREGTLGLLFLTDLKGYDVVFGKFVSLSINSLYGILTLAPLLAFAFLLGGISPSQFLLMNACLLNTLFFSLAVGILVSTFSQHERQAMGATLAIIFVAAVAPYAIAAAHTYEGLEIWQAMLPGFLVTSPVFGFLNVLDPNLSFFLRDEILLSLAFSHLAGWLCLVVASACVAARAQQDAGRGAILTLIHNLRVRLAYGKAQQRRAIRAETLDRNAFYWLAGRDRLKSRYAWFFISLLGGLWLVARWKAEDLVTDWPVTLGILWFVHLFFKVWIASEVSARFIEDRRTNALELLLTTPLGLRDFARGQWLALRRQFAGPLSAVMALDLFAAYNAGGSFGYALQSNSPWQYFLAGIFIFVADAYTIYWVSIWRSLHLRGANRTILQAIFLVVWVPVGGLFLISRGSWVFSILFGTQELDNPSLLWVWTIVSLLYDGLLVAVARNAFMRDFREVASSAFESPVKLAPGPEPEAVVAARRNVRRPRFRPMRWAVAGLAIVAVLLAGAALRRNRLGREVQDRLAAIRRAGLPVTAAEAASWRFAGTENDETSALLMRAQREIVSTRRPEFFRTDEQKMDFARGFVASNTAALKILEGLANRKAMVRTVRTDATRPTVGPLSPENILQLVEWKALVDLENRAPNAGRSISLVLHMARIFDGENFRGPGMGRQGLQIASEMLERAAASGEFGEAQWREWQGILRQIDPLAKLRAMLVIHRVEGLEVFESPPDVLWQNFGRGTTSFASVYSASLSIRKFLGQDQREVLDFLDFMQVAIDDCQRPYWEAPYRNYEYGWRSVGFGVVGSSMILPQLMPAASWLRRGAFVRMTRVRLMELASDIEIYRAQHGEVPKGLSGIGITDFIDPFDGQPLRYRVNEQGSGSRSGYVLYSVGEDRKDNGGQRVSRSMARGMGDIVFTCGEAGAGLRMGTPLD